MLRRLLRAFMGADQEDERFHTTFNRRIADRGFLEGRSGFLIDIGARDGVWTRQLLERLESRVTEPAGRPGLTPLVAEISPEFLAKARQHMRCVVVNVERSGLPFKSRSAAGIMMNQVLEHLKDPFGVLGEADRVLGIGGVLLIGVPNLAGLMNRLYLLAGLQPPAIHMPGPHVRGFTLRAMRAFLSGNANFRLRDTFGSCLYPLPPVLSEWLAVFFPGLCSYMFFVVEKVADAQPSPWLSARDTGETTFGDG